MAKYDGLVSMLGFFVIIVSLIGAVAGAREALAGGEEAATIELVELTYEKEFSGYTSENGDSTEEISTTDISEALDSVLEVSVSLSWTDEPATTPNKENQPDSFSVTIKTPSGEEIDSDSDISGRVSASYEIDPEEEPTNKGTGTYEITINCNSAGDHEPLVNILGFRTDPDDGNDWTLTVKVKYMGPEEEEEGEQTGFLGSIFDINVF